MHVYAPGQATYLPVAISFAANDAIRVLPVTFPEPETYIFKPLNERQLVYSKPFRLTQPITVPTITLEGDANGAPHPEPSAYASKFTGTYQHRLITGGIGHNLPQEAPEAFARAVLDLPGR